MAQRRPSAVAGTRSVEAIRLQGLVERSRYAAEKNLESVYTPIVAQFRAPSKEGSIP